MGVLGAARPTIGLAHNDQERRTIIPPIKSATKINSHQHINQNQSLLVVLFTRCFCQFISSVYVHRNVYVWHRGSPSIVMAAC
jgi:hypothetical protein